MIEKRCFIFDLDGVLVDSKEIHFLALNEALKEIDEKYIISPEDQKNLYEGLSTNQKLNILTENVGLPTHYYDHIWKSKQDKSIAFFNNLQTNNNLIEIFKLIKSYGILIGVASNSIRQTLETCLKSLGIIDMVDFYISNEDVTSPKPDPEMYDKCIKYFNCDINNTTIFEDSYIGKTAASLSGARLVSINGTEDVTIDLIQNEINKKYLLPNILIPMAGEGSRFKKFGYNMPKYLIDIHGKTMIETVVKNIEIEANYIFVITEKDENEYNVSEHIKNICKNFTIVLQKEKLSGAALSALIAKEYINNKNPLIIANCDQYIIWNNRETIKNFIESGIDGFILTFNANDKRWSYVKKNMHGIVTAVAEKNIISNEATCGIYYWKTGQDFVKYAEKMILNGNKTNNEFYICPVYNEAILDEKIIKTKKVYEMWGLGTPEDLNKYIKENSFGID